MARAGTDVMEIELTPADGAALPGYRAGQYVPLAFDGLERSYSLIGAAGVDGARSYRIGVKRNRPGDGLSGRLHDALAQAGASTLRVSLQTPRGHFLLPLQRSVPVVLVAAGIGITPFLSMLETLAESGATDGPPILLLYGSRDREHHAFAARLAVLARRLPCLGVVDTYSQPGPADVPGRDFRHAGRLGAHLVPPTWIVQQARFYLCGPEAMMRGMREQLLARGAHRFAIFKESFQSPAPQVDALAGPFSVGFRRSGRHLQWTPAEGSLLALAARHGLALPSGCRVGQCESCLLRVVSGKVAHLAEVDLAEAGTCLGCLSIPASDVVLDA